MNVFHDKIKDEYLVTLALLRFLATCNCIGCVNKSELFLPGVLFNMYFTSIYGPLVLLHGKTCTNHVQTYVQYSYSILYIRVECGNFF